MKGACQCHHIARMLQDAGPAALNLHLDAAQPRPPKRPSLSGYGAAEPCFVRLQRWQGGDREGGRLGQAGAARGVQLGWRLRRQPRQPTLLAPLSWPEPATFCSPTASATFVPPPHGIPLALLPPQPLLPTPDRRQDSTRVSEGVFTMVYCFTQVQERALWICGCSAASSKFRISEEGRNVS